MLCPVLPAQPPAAWTHLISDVISGERGNWRKAGIETTTTAKTMTIKMNTYMIQAENQD
jgi:hypothetical protein